MLTNVNPILPMRSKDKTKVYYLNKLGFLECEDYDNYLIIKKDAVEIHFFEFRGLQPKENYGQVYIRTIGIENLYQFLLEKKISIHPYGHLELKPWGQKEFSLLDPDGNLLTFGESL
ncbi:VOC family protein [Muricauda sp. SCSIO 64092]|uniref:bleomycin resistance protein n=1 Tax=Allomuricauda sp. SCSIO 64092 TaxID=2908842 RepID=UPI001FF28CD3|nr:VOC family protein [Muricauda sp. SCSIO 64092]UOY05372.1 VOC family protein [Muricauda sp. SCSIO 64092]